MAFWLMLLYTDIFNYLMFYPTQLGSTDLSDYKNSKAYSYYKSGLFQPLYFRKLSGSKCCLFKGECRQSQRINEINHKLWIIMEKSDKIRSYHCTCMAGMNQSCNHVAAAMYRIEATVRDGFTNLSCTSTANRWLPNLKEVQPIKLKDMNFGREGLCQRGQKKRQFVSTPKKKYNPLSEQGNMKMLTLNNFAEELKNVCPESTLFSAISKPDIDFVSDVVKPQTDEVPENFCSVYDWISKSANVEDFFANLFVNMLRENISKIELTRGQTTTNCGITTGKKLLQPQRLILF